MKKYEIVTANLRKRIINGEFDAKKKLPTEKILAAEYKVSLITIKKAILLLANEGLISTRQGSGMYVDRSDQRTLKSQYRSTNQGFSATHEGKNFTTKVYRLHIIAADQKLAECLNIALNDEVYELYRIRIVDNIPVVLEKSYYPKKIIGNLTPAICQQSIYHHLKNTLNLSLSHSLDYYLVEDPQEIDYLLLELLPKEKIVTLEQIAFLKNDIPFQYSISKTKTSFFQYKTITDLT